MAAKWITGVSLAVCLLAASITIGVACLTATRLTAADVPILLFVVGPYFALAGLAWWQRRQPVMRITLLVVIAVLSLAGVTLIGIDSYHFATEPPNRQTQHMAVFLVPLAQWLVIFVVAPFVLLAAIAGRRSGGPLPTSARTTNRSTDCVVPRLRWERTAVEALPRMPANCEMKHFRQAEPATQRVPGQSPGTRLCRYQCRHGFGGGQSVTI